MPSTMPRVRSRDPADGGRCDRCGGYPRSLLILPALIAACLPCHRAARSQEPPAAVLADAPAAAQNDVVATVGGDVIQRRDLDRVVSRAAAALQGDLVSDDKRRELEATAVEQLVDQRLLQREISKSGITVATEEVDAAVRRLREQLKERSIAWDQFLLRSGLDEEAVRAQSALEVGLNKLLEPRLTDDRLEAVFQRQRRELDGSRLRVSHIVLRPDLGRGDAAVAETVAKAARIRGLVLRSDLSFAEAARRHSMGPSRFEGGDLGWLPRQGQFHDEFARQAFALAKGEVSPPTVTPWGIHLIQVTAIEPGQGTLESLRPELTRRAAADLLRETVATARATTPIIYAAGLHYFDPATPADGREPRRVIVAEGARP